MYELVFRHLMVKKSDSILEIGCGLGNGCIALHKKYQPKYVIGIDITKEQIKRAFKRHRLFVNSHKDSIKFLHSSAEDIHVAPKSISKCFSIEALQHFESINYFLNSAFNVLKPNGKLIIATFFFNITPPAEFFLNFPNFASGVDKVVEIEDFLSEAKTHGFRDVKYKNIGKYVWTKFDQWIAQTAYRETWDRNWLQAYKNGILDYYIIEMIRD